MCMFSDKKVDTIELVAHGAGGIEELHAHLHDGDLSFALFRVVDRVDLSDTVKFVLIHWLGPTVSAIFKGRAGINTASLKKLFEPYHVAFENTEELGQITMELVMAKVQDASGTRSHVTEKKEGVQERGFTQTSKAAPGASHAVGASSAKTPTVPSPARSPAAASAAGGGGGESVKVSEAVHAAIRDVRSDASEVDWALAAFPSMADISEVVLVGSGPGGLAALKEHLSKENYFYGLVRYTDVIDGHPTIKFAHFTFVGDDVPPLKKAKISTFRAAVNAAFSPYHVESLASDVSELTDEDFMRKIGAASGSLSHVKE
jgi:hypothetical protein